MKHLVIEIQTLQDGQIGSIVNAYDTQAEAESKYHSVLSAAAISKIPAHGAIILDSNCTPKDWKCYTE